MTTILQLNTSIHSDAAASSQLADELVRGLKSSDHDTRLVQRDLATDPVPHLDAETFKAFLTPPAERSERQQQLAAESDELVGELKDADILVIGLPMYNFGVPSTLKAWFDHVARAGKTFRYTQDGPVGLVTGTKAYVVATRGGRYAGTASDTQTGFVRNFLRFLGIKDVEFVYAEGLALGEESRKRSLSEARESLLRLAA